jgi:hypothetical protein
MTYAVVTRIKRKIRIAVMTSLVAGYVAVDIWLYAFSKMALMDSILLDVLITMGFIILAVIGYAATRGDDDSS